jgi:hypothetical protein
LIFLSSRTLAASSAGLTAPRSGPEPTATTGFDPAPDPDEPAEIRT